MELIGIIIAFGLGVWTFIDSRKRGRSGISSFLWGTGVFLLLIVFLPLHLITRPKLPGEAVPATPRLCPHCGKYYAGDPKFCPNCSHVLKE